MGVAAGGTNNPEWEAVMSEQTSVRIERRTLFVGSMAYPLQGIVGVQALEWVVDSDRIKREYFRRIALTVAIGLCVVGTAWGQNAGVGIVAALVVAGIIALLVRARNNKLAQPPVYALTIQNAAGSQNLVFSENAGQISSIVSGIIDAIDDSNTKFGPILIDRSTNVNTGRDYVRVDGSGNTVSTGR